MMISPIIFCTIVLGIGSVRKAAKVGAVGGIALGYFMVMSLVALAIGLVVGNILEPGTGLALTDAVKEAGQAQVVGEAKAPSTSCSGSSRPRSSPRSPTARSCRPCSSPCSPASPSRRMGSAGQPVLRGVEHIQRLVFRILAMVMWAAPSAPSAPSPPSPVRAGLDALKSLAVLMLGFYVTCFLFVFVVLGTLLRLVHGPEHLLAASSTWAASSC